MKTFIVYTISGSTIIEARDIQNVIKQCFYGKEEIKYIKEVLTTKTHMVTETWMQLISSKRITEHV